MGFSNMVWICPSQHPGATVVINEIDVRFKIRESRSVQFENDEFIIAVDFNKMVTYDSTIQALIMKYPLDIRGLNMKTSRVKVIKLEEPEEVEELEE